MFDVWELNFAIALWDAAFCVIGISCLMLFARNTMRYRKLFILGFSLELVAASSDAFAGLLRGQADSLSWMLCNIANRVSFVSSFLLIPVLTNYLCQRVEEAGGPSFCQWRRAVLAISLALGCLAVAGVFFTIDERSVYHRTDWYWLSMAPIALISVVNATMTFVRWRQMDRRALTCLLCCTVIPMIAAAIQLFVNGPNLVMVARTLGLVAVFFELMAHTSRKMVEQSEALARSQIEVSESRIAVMVSQIQPHFIFNTLDTIYGLCDEDALLAKDAIASFSRYLRTNINSLTRSVPVPIEREIEHLRTYLELERLSDESRLTYEIDLAATGFGVPALSVQTLAENAVKHGLGDREQGGHILVRTSEGTDEYVVEVADDGVGFDVVRVRDESRHIGLSNTRARLEAMCNGTLEVTSVPEVGTTARMRIPKRRGGQ